MIEKKPRLENLEHKLKRLSFNLLYILFNASMINYSKEKMPKNLKNLKALA